jgi:CRP-like cAMP-binding protein
VQTHAPPFERGPRVFDIGDPPDSIYGVVSGCFGFEACQDVAVKVRHLLWALPSFLRMAIGSYSFSG